MSTIVSHVRNTAYVSGNLISIEGFVPDDVIQGYEVEWYDLSLEAGRNANGTMHLSYIGDKYKIILKTSAMFQDQLADFYSHIPMRAIEVTFFNPFTGQNKTIQCYRGDRKVSMLFDFNGVGKFYDSTSQSLIEL